jgi:GNAT superfamily N-acetyltransferase
MTSAAADPSTTAQHLVVRQAQSEADFEAIRVIRNAGRHWFEDTRVIEPDEQADFRRAAPYAIWLYLLGDDVVGWGLVRPGDGGQPYVSLAVAREHRGRGYGTRMFRDLRTRWRAPVWARIRSDNIRSLCAALAAGYVIVEEDRGGGTMTLRCP